MAGPEAAPSWERVDSAFEFDQSRPQHIPRGWERAPKSPHRAHQKGRKLWKRPEPRAPCVQDYPSTEHNGEERKALGELSNNTSRAVKKLRLKDQDATREAKDTKGSRYLATLRDAAQSTPRRKQTTTRLDVPLTQVLEQGSSDVESSETGNSDNQLIEDSMRASSSPVHLEVRNISSSSSSATEEEAPVGGQEAKVRGETCESEESFPAGGFQEETQPADTEAGMTPGIEMGKGPAQEPESPSLDEYLVPKKEEAAANDQHVSDTSEANAGVMKTSDVLEAVADTEAGMTPRIEMGKEPAQEPESPSLDEYLVPKKEEAATNDQHAPDAFEANAGVLETSDVLEAVTQDLPEKEAQVVSTRHSPAEGTDLRHPPRILSPVGLTPRAHQIRDIFGPESPQIGTTLLRRESLRKKDSPRKGPGRPKGSSPKKQLKKRDTLQEREILQRFEESDAENKKDLEHPGDSAAPFTPSVVLLPHHHSEISNIATIEGVENNVNDEQVLHDVGEAILESQDLQRAVEAIEASEEVHRSTTAPEHTDSVPDDDANRQAYEAIAHAEVDEAQAATTAVCEKADLPVRKTRSGARFSDDTSMLRDFLNRAQARKAAQGSGFSPKIPKSLQESPRGSAQKKDAIRPASRSSPRKARVLTPRQAKCQKGSPSGKAALRLAKSDYEEEDDEGHNDETNGEGTKSADPGSCRRSTRTRLPGLVKTPPGAPSFIPVRRTDGTDPVVLQKAQAQELAITTRANTRRNKGQAKTPTLALQDIIPSGDAESTTWSRQRAANGKAVVWAEQLTSFQEWQEGITEESEEQVPKVKRMRGLGNSTGTPLAKRTAGMTSASNGTPAPKRRGKAR